MKRSLLFQLIASILFAAAANAQDAATPGVSKPASADSGKKTPCDEPLRPQFHFTAARNWLNDPNGLVYYKGEYHLFFQHNPSANEWGNMTWGHAVSPDMLHWKQLDNAILPDKLGTIFSGSAVVDWNNTAGFQTGDEKPIVCIYTSAGGNSPESKGQPFTQSLAFSNDRGRTWTKYPNNPVLKHISGANRDPKVLWHAPTKQWIMALYLDAPAKNDFALFRSPNLKDWTRLCTVTLPGSVECPDLFELPVDADANKKQWGFWGANNQYVLGTFDGTTFTMTSKPLQCHFGLNRYAAQTYSDIPPSDGRTLQIAWMAAGKYPGMPFNQQMSVPAELTLRTFPDGVQLCVLPVRELERLRGQPFAWAGTLKPNVNPLAGLVGELFDVVLDIEPQDARQIVLNVRGTPIQFDVKDEKLSCLDTSAHIAPSDGRLELRVLVDRSSIEIFTVDGRVNMAYTFLPPENDRTLKLSSQGGDAVVRLLKVWPVKSVWAK